MDEKQVAQVAQATQMTWTEILKVAYQILNYQLFELDGHGVSLGKLISGVVLLVVGYMVSRRGAKEVDNRLYTRLDIDQALRYTFRRLTFYFFLCLTTLFTLHTLAVPVTIFTVLGGAFAVGIGFGSQNLINNFISGILVMIERPIRVGDFVEVGDITGQIESIGIRATEMRTGVNSVIIIPNTNFIEKNLTNWTKSEVIQCPVRIGVAYGTDMVLLRKVCMEALAGVGEVVNEPAPDLVFQDFGDDALLLDLTFSIAALSVPNRKKIASDVRYRLNDLFIRNKIDVPFPQRVVRMLT